MHSRTKSFLVTGGTGFLGSALVQRLVNSGYQVRVLDNDWRGSISRLHNIAGQFEFVAGDIRNPGDVEAAAAGMDAICHLAFVNGTEFFYSEPELVLDVGVRGMMNVLDACLKHGIQELVLASSSEVYQTPPVIPTPEDVPLMIPDPLNPRYSYAAGKIISEILSINYGRRYFRRVVIFRPHNVYGPDMGWEHVIPQFILRMKRLCQETDAPQLRFPIQGSGQETRSFIYIDDFTNGLMQVIERGEHLGIYHIGTMDERSIADVARAVGGYFGREIEVVPGDLALGSTPRRCPDITYLRALGFTAAYTFDEGLDLTARWYEQHAHLAPNNL